MAEANAAPLSDQLQQRRAQLLIAREQMVAQIARIDGAIAECDHWLGVAQQQEEAAAAGQLDEGAAEQVAFEEHQANGAGDEEQMSHDG